MFGLFKKMFSKRGNKAYRVAESLVKLARTRRATPEQVTQYKESLKKIVDAINNKEDVELPILIPNKGEELTVRINPRDKFVVVIDHGESSYPNGYDPVSKIDNEDFLKRCFDMEHAYDVSIADAAILVLRQHINDGDPFIIGGELFIVEDNEIESIEELIRDLAVK